MATFIVVDDSKISRSLIKTILIENGHDVIAEADNGQEGYELYVKYMPDIIILDVVMPVLQGIDCLKKIKSEYREAKIIIVSSIAKSSKKTEAILEGAMVYIVKPVDPDLLINAVELCIKA